MRVQERLRALRQHFFISPEEDCEPCPLQVLFRRYDRIAGAFPAGCGRKGFSLFGLYGMEIRQDSPGLVSPDGKVQRGIQLVQFF